MFEKCIVSNSLFGQVLLECCLSGFTVLQRLVKYTHSLRLNFFYVNNNILYIRSKNKGDNDHGIFSWFCTFFWFGFRLMTVWACRERKIHRLMGAMCVSNYLIGIFSLSSLWNEINETEFNQFNQFNGRIMWNRLIVSNGKHSVWSDFGLYFSNCQYQFVSDCKYERKKTLQRHERGPLKQVKSSKNLYVRYHNLSIFNSIFNLFICKLNSSTTQKWKNAENGGKSLIQKKIQFGILNKKKMTKQNRQLLIEFVVSILVFTLSNFLVKEIWTFW